MVYHWKTATIWEILRGGKFHMALTIIAICTDNTPIAKHNLTLKIPLTGTCFCWGEVPMTFAIKSNNGSTELHHLLRQSRCSGWSINRWYAWATFPFVHRNAGVIKTTWIGIPILSGLPESWRFTFFSKLLSGYFLDPSLKSWIHDDSDCTSNDIPETVSSLDSIDLDWHVSII
jgi:hypothetical protein